MFQKRTGQLAAILMLVSVTAQPMTSLASEPSAPAVKMAPAPIAQGNKVSVFNDLSFTDIRFETKAALSETKQWVKDKTAQQNYQNPIKILELKVDRFQDSVKPAGRSMKASLKQKLRGLVNFTMGGQVISVFGFMLMMAFGLVLFLMGLAGPTLLLGGRH